MPAIYRASFDEGEDEFVKAEDFEQALHLAKQTWLGQNLVSFELVAANHGQGPQRAIRIDAQGNPKPNPPGQTVNGKAKA